MNKLNLVSILVFLISINLVAQENNSLKNRKAQVTFAYPIGSSGMSSMEYSNNFSFNILYGLNGGVDGVEIGSILNYNKGEVKGFQLSGVSNINIGYTKGLLLTGVSNICMDSTTGLFISGVLNYSKKNAKGFQLSGVVNINGGYSKGFLLTGVSNICMDSTSGLFISGVLNYSRKNAKGFQLATTNIAINEFHGFQLGVFNYAKKLKGVQLGVFNYFSDGEEALPIGIFSIVKNGHYELELTGGEVIYSSLNYKMGVDRFYTIYKAGLSSYNNNPVYSYGLGFGSNLSIAENHKLSIDLSANSITYNNNWNSELNLLNKIDLNYNFFISQKFSLLIGPSLNVYVTKEKVDGQFGTLKVPYSIYTNEWSNGKLFMWFGLNAGLSLKL